MPCMYVCNAGKKCTRKHLGKSHQAMSKPVSVSMSDHQRLHNCQWVLSGSEKTYSPTTTTAHAEDDDGVKEDILWW